MERMLIMSQELIATYQAEYPVSFCSLCLTVPRNVKISCISCYCCFCIRNMEIKTFSPPLVFLVKQYPDTVLIVWGNVTIDPVLSVETA